MRQIALRGGDLEGFRAAARELLAAGLPPAEVLWSVQGAGDPLALPGLLDPAAAERRPATGAAVPRAFLRLAEAAVCHRAPDALGLLYRVVYRLTHGEPRLLEVAVDEDVHRLGRLAQAVRRDEHKMHAFTRFRRVGDDGERFLAWHAPDHYILRLAAPFFVRRFGAMRWTLVTPDESAAWDGAALRYLPGSPLPPSAEDPLDELWRSYYGAVFNPARVNPTAMLRELPRRHWRTLPEARLIEPLLRAAAGRVAAMVERPPRNAADFLPGPGASLAVLRDAAAACRGCELCEDATATVFGEGPEAAPLVLVGEQPGDREDRAGVPFVGPAGQLLDALIAEAGLSQQTMYKTNAVKHFRHRAQEGRRLHVTPAMRHVVACRPWLEAELQALRPRAVLCLGATAARALLGPSLIFSEVRGAPLACAWAPWLLVTHHPAAVLRAAEEPLRQRLRQELVEDLRRCAAALPALTSPPEDAGQSMVGKPRLALLRSPR